MRFATRSIRVGQEPDSAFGAVINPIWQSSTFAWPNLEAIPKFDYTRVANPNRATLEQVVASLENAKHGVAFASGMAAIDAVLAQLRQGDHMLMASDIYGGTHRLVHTVLPRYGIEATEFDASDPDSLIAAIRPNSKMLIFESPTNPNVRIMDIARTAAIGRERGIVTVFDNTFASPYLQNPLDLGIDVVIHSTTKYIAGHSDVIGGVAVTNDDAIHTFLYEYLKTTGAVPSPFDCWLTVRGVKTLAVRMEKHCANAFAVAQHLEKHPKVERVHYPGLPSHPDHAVAAKQMRAFGAMVAVEVKGGAEEARRVAESTEVFVLAESLGGVESLIGYPPLMSHASMTEEERAAKGIPPNMLRLSIGIEDTEDLIEDLDKALG